MNKLICILAVAALLGACEKKTDTVAPAAPAAPVEKKSDQPVDPNTFSKSQAVGRAGPATKGDTSAAVAASPTP